MNESTPSNAMTLRTQFDPDCLSLGQCRHNAMEAIEQLKSMPSDSVTDFLSHNGGFGLLIRYIRAGDDLLQILDNLSSDQFTQIFSQDLAVHNFIDKRGIVAMGWIIEKLKNISNDQRTQILTAIGAKETLMRHGLSRTLIRDSWQQITPK